MAPREFLVRLVMIYKHTKFHCSTTICIVGLAFLNFLGGAVEPFFPAFFARRIKSAIFTRTDAHANFGEFWYTFVEVI